MLIDHSCLSVNGTPLQLFLLAKVDLVVNGASSVSDLDPRHRFGNCKEFVIESTLLEHHSSRRIETQRRSYRCEGVTIVER